MLEFREAVRQVIEKVDRDYVFDSHFVIDQLIKSYSDEYIVFVSRFAHGERPTFTAHGQIGQVISSFDGDLVEHLPYQSWSETIHCDGGKCALWKRK